MIYFCEANIELKKMEPGPSRSTRQTNKPANQDTKGKQEEKSGNPSGMVPAEVAEMMENAIWPSDKMNDMLYNSLFQKPVMIFPTNAMNKLEMKGEFIYQDVEKVVKKIRRKQKPDENDQPEAKAQQDDEAEGNTNTDSE